MNQRLFRQTDDGWFVYQEQKSCALYADFDTGTMIRLSYRADEHRVYFSAYNRNWKFTDLGETLMIHLHFPDLGRMHGSAAVTVENPDGRQGYSADSFARDFIDDFALSNGMILQVMWNGDENIDVETFDLVGSDHAVRLLQTCHANFFDGEF
jgi:hypothetical protein